MARIMLFIVLALSLPSLAQPAAPAAAAASGDTRMDWWREARFGMFIHWGLYAIPAGEWEGERIGGVGEWIMHTGRIAPEEYEKLAPRFDPQAFDAAEWVSLAKSAGMKYIVITSKHHDGFCLFDSALTEYDVTDATPFGRDILKELADECAKQGVRLGFYHSIMDWHHPLAKGETFPRYAEHMRGQVKELLTNYGPVSVMWFDGEWIEEWTEEQGRELYDLCRELQPGVIVNNRVGKGRDGMAGLSKSPDAAGDFGTPEQEVPATGIPGVDWESCMTMNGTWGYRADDHNWKSSEMLIRTLVDSASKGGNFLLNVGPKADGTIPPESVERLRAMGRWLEVNGEAVYGTSAGPFTRLRWGRCTAGGAEADGTLYLHVFDWPEDGRLLVPGLRSEVLGAALLGAPGERLPVEATEEGVVISVPAAAPDAAATVIKLSIAGEADVEPYTIRQSEDGSVTLDAFDAEVRGGHARYESREDRRCIGFWTDPADTVHWEFFVARPSEFDVRIEWACPEEAAGSEYRVVFDGRSIAGRVESTGGWGEFKSRIVGRVPMGRPGRHTVAVEPVSKPGHAVMNLRSVRLVPVR